ncbi:MAG: protein translocase subunit SecF, partial [Oscillospiraceae bacterium]
MFDILKKKWIFFGIAIVLSLVSIVSLIFQGFNLDTDFAGGMAVTYEITGDFKTADIESIVSEALGVNQTASSVQQSGKEVIIKFGFDNNLKTDEERSEFALGKISSITAALETKYGTPVTTEAPKEGEAPVATPAPSADPAVSATPAPATSAAPAEGAKNLVSGVVLKNQDIVSPSTGRELANSAFWMSILACFAILLYVTFRFEFTSGVVAIVALAHDVLLLLGLYSLFRMSVNVNFIAAVLTVLGYSINNTIVIMDRIRENTRHSRKETYGEIANSSIWQTMARSINTTVTTLLTIGMVYILGVPSIQQFAFPIIFGIIVGTFSSIFISGPLWATWRDSAVNAKKKNAAVASKK